MTSIKISVVALTTLLLSVLTGTAGNDVKSTELTVAEAEVETVSSPVSGVYYMHGQKVDLTLCWLGPFCEVGEVLSSDTLRIAFTVNVSWNEERPDTVQFFGLEGANAGNSLYRPHPAVCRTAPDCAFAGWNGSDLEIYMLSPSGLYIGTGTLGDGIMTLETQFRYRGRGTDYQLSGTRIDLE